MCGTTLSVRAPFSGTDDRLIRPSACRLIIIGEPVIVLALECCRQHIAAVAHTLVSGNVALLLTMAIDGLLRIAPIDTDGRDTTRHSVVNTLSSRGTTTGASDRWSRVVTPVKSQLSFN